MEKLQSNYNQQVYILAFHVDYWNRLGWRDRFSKPEFSERQQQYASWLHTENIYTPQVVINGESEMVGSNAGAVLKTVQSALAGTALPLLHYGKTKGLSSIGLIRQHASQSTDHALLLSLVKKQASSAVLTGENAGRKLTHIQIVETLKHAELKNTDAISLDCPDNYKPGDWEIIALIQDKNNGKIIAAARADL